LVGGTAVTALLGDKDGITKIRGKFYDYSNQYLATPIKTTAVFHPSYLLRSPGQKKVAWHDALMIKKYIRENGIKV
jgi:DNA polymerase